MVLLWCMRIYMVWDLNSTLGPCSKWIVPRHWVLCEIGLVQKSRDEVGFYWLLEVGFYRVIGMSELEMDSSIVLLTDESNTNALQSPSFCKVKIELGLKGVMFLSDSTRIPWMWLTRHVLLHHVYKLRHLCKLRFSLNPLITRHCIWVWQNITHPTTGPLFILLLPHLVGTYLMLSNMPSVVESPIGSNIYRLW